MNKVFLLGRLGNDPEISFTSGNKMIAKFRLATNNHRDKNNADWHNCVYFDKLAEIVSKYATKGKQVLVEGHLSYYEKDNFRKTEIIGEELTLLGSPSQPSITRKSLPDPDSIAFADYVDNYDNYDPDIPF